MKEVRVEHVKISNFKSFIADDFAFPVGGFNFLSGANDIENALGANGAGKSSLWDAICFCLYGQDSQGNRASDLTRWGSKRPMVSVSMAIDGNEKGYLVERYGNPNQLILDGNIVEQYEINNLVGLTKDRFLQSVLFAQKSKQFMDMNANERGELFDSILNLESWLKLAVNAADMAKGYREEIDKLSREQTGWYARLRDDAYIDAIKVKQLSWLQMNNASLEAEVKLVEQMEKKVASSVEERNRLEKELEGIANPNGLDKDVDKLMKEAAKLYSEKQVLLARHAAALKQSFFLRDNSTCPVCQQKLTNKHKLEMHQVNQDEQTLVNTAISEIDAKRKPLLEEIDIIQTEIANRSRVSREMRTVINSLLNHIAADERELQMRAKDLGRILDQVNPFDEQYDKIMLEQDTARANIARLNEVILREQEEFRRMDYWRTGFKRVRLFLVKQTLDLVQLEANNAAQALGLLGWHISFVTEVENKSGNMKPGIEMIIDSPHAQGAWRLTSGGEEQRVRMAVTLGIAAMIERMSGVNFAFEIWDEPSAHLSAEGISDLLECLRYRAEVTGKAVWITDHTVLSSASFDRIYTVRKGKGGSKIELTGENLT
jgi:DNA repair exonuclease SbcCD ATPase subunit